MPPCRPLAIPSPARARIAIPLPGSAHDPNACTRKHWRMQTHHLVLLAYCEGVGVLVRVRTRITACALGAHSKHAPFANRGDATADARVRGRSPARQVGGGTSQTKQRLLHTGAPLHCVHAPHTGSAHAHHISIKCSRQIIETMHESASTPTGVPPGVSWTPNKVPCS